MVAGSYGLVTVCGYPAEHQFLRLAAHSQLVLPTDVKAHPTELGDTRIRLVGHARATQLTPISILNHRSSSDDVADSKLDADCRETSQCSQEVMPSRGTIPKAGQHQMSPETPNPEPHLATIHQKRHESDRRTICQAVGIGSLVAPARPVRSDVSVSDFVLDRALLSNVR